MEDMHKSFLRVERSGVPRVVKHGKTVCSLKYGFTWLRKARHLDLGTKNMILLNSITFGELRFVSFEGDCL